MGGEQKPIAIACDHAGLALKPVLVGAIEARGLQLVDLGTHTEESCDYPDFAHRVAAGVESGAYRLGVLVCGTGVGMSMAANRHSRVRAVVCSDVFTAKLARKHNDANILCLGARVVGSGLAMEILAAFLDAEFEGGRHATRVTKIEINKSEVA